MASYSNGFTDPRQMYSNYGSTSSLGAVSGMTAFIPTSATCVTATVPTVSTVHPHQYQNALLQQQINHQQQHLYAHPVTGMQEQIAQLQSRIEELEASVSALKIQRAQPYVPQKTTPHQNGAVLTHAEENSNLLSKLYTPHQF